MRSPVDLEVFQAYKMRTRPDFVRERSFTALLSSEHRLVLLNVPQTRLFLFPLEPAVVVEQSCFQPGSQASSLIRFVGSIALNEDFEPSSERKKNMENSEEPSWDEWSDQWIHTFNVEVDR